MSRYKYDIPTKVLPRDLTHAAARCSKLIVETLEQGVKLFKVNNKDTRTTPLASFCVFIVNFENISNLVLVFLLLTLSR